MSEIQIRRLEEAPHEVVLEKNEKIVHFQRHATGWHNVYGEKDRKEYLREDLEDAHLCDKGHEECAAVSEEESASSAQLLLVSPMRRTLQTASLSFPHLIDEVPWLALECLREVTGMHPCDRRVPLSEHIEAQSHVDFSLISDETDPLYHSYTEAGIREPVEDVMSRCQEFLEYLKTRRESEVVVCTHSAYLSVLFNEVFSIDSSEDKKRFRNCEIRSYVMSFPAPVA